MFVALFLLNIKTTREGGGEGGADNFLDLLIKLNSSFVCTH